MCRYYMEVLASLWWWESPESCSCTLCKGSDEVLGRLQNLIGVMRGSSEHRCVPQVSKDRWSYPVALNNLPRMTREGKGASSVGQTSRKGPSQGCKGRPGPSKENRDHNKRLAGTWINTVTIWGHWNPRGVVFWRIQMFLRLFHIPKKN